jgi:hypothetical protein
MPGSSGTAFSLSKPFVAISTVIALRELTKQYNWKIKIGSDEAPHAEL